MSIYRKVTEQNLKSFFAIPMRVWMSLSYFHFHTFLILVSSIPRRRIYRLKRCSNKIKIWKEWLLLWMTLLIITESVVHTIYAQGGEAWGFLILFMKTSVFSEYMGVKGRFYLSTNRRVCIATFFAARRFTIRHIRFLRTLQFFESLILVQARESKLERAPNDFIGSLNEEFLRKGTDDLLPWGNNSKNAEREYFDWMNAFSNEISFIFVQ